MIFEEGVLVDEVLKKGVQDALLRHKQMGQPIVAWRKGKIVWIKSEDIPIESN